MFCINAANEASGKDFAGEGAVTPQRMMDDFVREGQEQIEFDFGAKPEDELRPVFDAVSAAERKSGSRRVRGWRDMISAKIGDDVFFARPVPLPGQRRHFGEFAVIARWLMEDPLDSDFYEEHHPLLGAIAASMPKGFVAEFTTEDEYGDSSRFIGTKEILRRNVSRDSGPAGVETDDTYDVIETLAVRRADSVREAEDNPDDAKADELFVKGDEYEERLADGLAESDDDFIEVDFPTWALDYAVNAELGSVSRSEKFAVDKWFEMMDREGYDVNAVSYGDEEYFSSEPEFGLPCDCVKATVSRRKALGESSGAGPAGAILRYLVQDGASDEAKPATPARCLQ